MRPAASQVAHGIEPGNAALSSLGALRCGVFAWQRTRKAAELVAKRQKKRRNINETTITIYQDPLKIIKET